MFSSRVSVFAMLFFVGNFQANAQECNFVSDAERNVSKDFPYLGCFDQLCLQQAVNFSSPDLTIYLCSSRCNSSKHQVAGLLKGDYCMCGNLKCPVKERQCNSYCGVPCNDYRIDSPTFCGGHGFIQVYNVSFSNSTTQDINTEIRSPWWKDYRLLAVIIVAFCIILSAMCFFIALYVRLKKRRPKGGSRQHQQSSSKNVESCPDKSIMYPPPHKGALGETEMAVTMIPCYHVTTMQDAELDYHSYESCSHETEAVRIEQDSDRELSGGNIYHSYIEMEAADTSSLTPGIGGDTGHKYYTSIYLQKSQENEGEGDGEHKYYTSISNP